MTPDPAHILIASHGTPGAQAAEQAALAWCRAGGRLSHLIVVPDFWRGMQGDDWLNNASTRDTYGKYIESGRRQAACPIERQSSCPADRMIVAAHESELQREIDGHVGRLRAHAGTAGVIYEFSVVLGKPTQCLLEYARELAPALVVTGAPRPKGQPGLRSRMDFEQLAGALTAPLLVIPHPQ